MERRNRLIEGGAQKRASKFLKHGDLGHVREMGGDVGRLTGGCRECL
jgi:hypothetical protein